MGPVTLVQVYADKLFRLLYHYYAGKVQHHIDVLLAIIQQNFLNVYN